MTQGGKSVFPRNKHAKWLSNPSAQSRMCEYMCVYGRMHIYMCVCTHAKTLNSFIRLLLEMMLGYYWTNDIFALVETASSTC